MPILARLPDVHWYDLKLNKLHDAKIGWHVCKVLEKKIVEQHSFTGF